MKNVRKFLYVFVFIIALLFIGTLESKAGSLSLNNLDFEAQINSDGSMDVKETWDINISETNTLYKVFETDTSKYSGITNVVVKEITSGREKNFTKTNTWAYHVTRDYYYGTENDDGDFEIGWGVGLDNSRATRQYEISYRVKDAITKYNDYAELYWQFVGEDFEVSANKINGVIYLPSNVTNKEDIKVWGHTEDLNGTIYVTDTNKIEFEINNFRSGRYVEIRTLFPTELVNYSGRTKNKEILNTVINEETKWAEEANARRERQEWIDEYIPKILFLVFITINIILIVVFGKKTRKYYRKIKELQKYKPTTEMEYFREIPYESATPGEAVRNLNIYLSTFTPNVFGKVFSATMLDLVLKGFLEIKEEKNEKGKDVINIYRLKYVTEELKTDEARIMLFLRDASKGEKVITLKELEKFIKNHPSRIEDLLKDSYEIINKQLIDEEIIDEAIQQGEYKKYANSLAGYILGIVFSICFGAGFLFIIPVILFIVNAILCNKIAKKLNLLTQKGVDIQEQWKGLKKYMEDFSMLDRREVPELVIWERYLVYATAFGIADKVLKQLKIVYPNFDEISSTTNLSTYSYMNLMINTNFSSTFSNAISSSISSAHSSATGGGGGFSGGGGGGRWPVVAVAGR